MTTPGPLLGYGEDARLQRGQLVTIIFLCTSHENQRFDRFLCKLHKGYVGAHQQSSTMKAEGHLQKAEEIYSSILILADDDAHAVAITELAFCCAFHYLVYGCERKFQRHIDTHASLSHLLRAEGEGDIANAFGQLDTLRHGRFYGGKGNGKTIGEVLDLLEVIKQWSRG